MSKLNPILSIISGLIKANLFQTKLEPMFQFLIARRNGFNTLAHSAVRKRLFFVWKTILYGSIVCMIGRYFAIGYKLNFGGATFDSTFRYFDPVYYLMQLVSIFNNAYIMWATSLLAAFAFYMDYSMYFIMDLPLLMILQELAVKNRENFGQLNADIIEQKYSHFSTIKLIAHPTKSAKAWRKLFQLLWNRGEELNFANARLVSFPHLSKKIRSRAILITKFLDWLIGMVMFICGEYYSELAVYFLELAPRALKISAAALIREFTVFFNLI